MGQFDHNIDTAWALNQHGGTSMSAAGIDGNLEGMLSYHNKYWAYRSCIHVCCK
jgi:hypothetical protein